MVKNVKEKEKCDLCGLEIEGKEIVKEFDGEEKKFCCEGCKQVYNAAYENGLLDEVCPKPIEKPENKPAFILNNGETSYFSMEGMWCAGCATAAEQILLNQKGIKKADISFAAEKGRIQYDPDSVKPQEVLDKLSKLGYRAQVISDQQEKQKNKQQEKTLIQLLVAVGFGMQIMILYLVQLYPLYAQGDFNSTDVRNIQYLVWLLATPVMFYGGSSFLRGAWRAIKSGTATMDTLVAMGTLAAYGYSVYVTLVGNNEAYFDSVVMITTFIMLGRYIESIGGNEARKDIHKLLALRPKTAWIKKENDLEEINPVELNKGDLIVVKPGESIPADSVVISGEASINQSMLTGESNPVAIKEGDHIYAGTILFDGAINARVEKPLTTSRFSQIVDLVEQTLTSKPPIQRLADKVSVYFAFGILGIAIVTFAVRLLIIGEGFSIAILTAIAVLVVACPCALGLATPLALVVTLGQTSKAGLYVRKPGSLETAAKINRVVFDKTGTLTQGKLSVENIHVNPELQISEEELLDRAAAVEQYSEHPIGKAINKASSKRNMNIEQYKYVKGQGASAKYDGIRILVGSSEFLSVDKKSAISEMAEKYLTEGKSVVWVGWEYRIGGFIVLSDQPNISAKPALEKLSKMNIETVLLSGDNPTTTKAIAKKLDLSEFEGNCSPVDKSNRIKTWQESGMEIAMIGDGINDAPALAQADLSFTVAGGTDIAGETSDVVMIENDLTLIPWFITRSKRTRRIILENLGWAFAYNLIAVPLAAFALISPVIAAASMATSSLLVVGNSLRLRKN